MILPDQLTETWTNFLGTPLQPQRLQQPTQAVRCSLVSFQRRKIGLPDVGKLCLQSFQFDVQAGATPDQSLLAFADLIETAKIGCVQDDQIAKTPCPQ
jgi:hypothetical protein